MNTRRVIKADSMSQPGNKIVFDFEDFHQHCDNQLRKAQEQAHRQVSEAQNRAVSIEEQAKADGYSAGYAEGLKNANEEVQKRVDALAKQAIDKGLANKLHIVESLTADISEARLKWLAHWEHVALKFSVLLAEKIIRSEVSRRPEIRPQMIREVLEVISAEERIVVRLHPDDVQYFEEVKQTLSASSPVNQFMEFESDPNLTPGDCLAEMEFGFLDGRIETQLKRIQAELSPENEDDGD